MRVVCTICHVKNSVLHIDISYLHTGKIHISCRNCLCMLDTFLNGKYCKNWIALSKCSRSIFLTLLMFCLLELLDLNQRKNVRIQSPSAVAHYVIRADYIYIFYRNDSINCHIPNNFILNVLYILYVKTITFLAELIYVSSTQIGLLRCD